MKFDIFPVTVPIRKLDWQKLIKLSIGTIFAILIAHLFKLQYAYAAGIITLLTIQDTRRETISISIKRSVIFVVMTLLSILIFPFTGYTILGFALLLIPYLFFCMWLEMKEAIAPIAVLCTHYISSSSCSSSMIANELGILLIGAGIGIILNLFFTDNLMIVHQKQLLIEKRIKAVLERMALYITKEDKSLYTDSCFIQLDQLLEDLRNEIIQYSNNHFLGLNDTFYSYLYLRIAQCRILKRIYKDITRIDMVPSQSHPISDFLICLAKDFEKEESSNDLLDKLKELNQYYDQDTLPVTREEFKNRALLYHILKDLEAFIP